MFASDDLNLSLLPQVTLLEKFAMICYFQSSYSYDHLSLNLSSRAKNPKSVFGTFVASFGENETNTPLNLCIYKYT